MNWPISPGGRMTHKSFFIIYHLILNCSKYFANDRALFCIIIPNWIKRIRNLLQEKMGAPCEQEQLVCPSAYHLWQTVALNSCLEREIWAQPLPAGCLVSSDQTIHLTYLQCLQHQEIITQIDSHCHWNLKPEEAFRKCKTITRNCYLLKSDSNPFSLAPSCSHQGPQQDPDW